MTALEKVTSTFYFSWGTGESIRNWESHTLDSILKELGLAAFKVWKLLSKSYDIIKSKAYHSFHFTFFSLITYEEMLYSEIVIIYKEQKILEKFNIGSWWLF